uniref:Exocyst subunit Exo70 family protein n=1 Tax=Arundo donax TaxID=35708 RepID=A0A0A9U4R6_ARUDO
MFPDEKDRQQIFILNNACFVWQKKHDPRGFLSNEQVERVYSEIQECIMCYLNEYWAPLLTYLEGDSLRRPCWSSLDKFTGEFDSKCGRQMKWKVRTELKNILREKITSLLIRPYEQFLVALQATPSSTCFAVKRLILDLLFFGKKRGDIYTVVQLESTLVALFER